MWGGWAGCTGGLWRCLRQSCSRGGGSSPWSAPDVTPFFRLSQLRLGSRGCRQGPRPGERVGATAMRRAELVHLQTLVGRIGRGR